MKTIQMRNLDCLFLCHFMRKLSLILFFFYFTCSVFSQETSTNALEKYLEDQFYFGVGINFLGNRPENVVQSSLSYSLQTGFIKDIPLNKSRNFGLGLGLGYAANSYYSNIGATNDTGEVLYRILDSEEFQRNKLETHAIEVPLEIRWRTSTPTDYKFWRIYTGIRFGYVFSGRSKTVFEEENISFSNDDIEDFQYGLTLSFGYNTWNVHAYYGLNQLLSDTAVLDTAEAIEVNVLRIGLIFYIL